MKFSVFLQRDSAISSQGGVVSSDDELHSLDYDFYRQNCPQAESIADNHKFDPDVFLDDSNGNKNHSVERQATPNKTLRGINEIDMIKEELENACPGVVSCADTLAFATRDAVVLAGGPYYPIFTSKRDSTQSYFDEAMDEIPKPNNNITQTLFLLSPEVLMKEKTVNLLGAHNLGKSSCDSIGCCNSPAASGRPPAKRLVQSHTLFAAATRGADAVLGCARRILYLILS
ncbi:hypothetical protein SADUNF_Sadunf07G0056100 [Salix dunnii]|uniref:peroxidase n=1 Tax=Salix dunnii TaxID=1413687 RepID=A0A835K510_9ROSI|nr:hypothetical protein SADUNF_Sadunf07G0056100 [Salix dunnii]